MPFRFYPLLSVLCSLILVAFNFLLQLVALTTSWWAIFTARTDLGKPKVNGHYGLWTLCSIKGPHWTEDCDPLDSFFQVPTFSQVSGIVAIVHLLLLLVLLPVELLWAAQMFQNLPKMCLKPKVICITKISAAFLAVILAILVAILISIGENRQKEYFIQKGWSFWIQISVIIVNVVINILFLFENLRFWKQHVLQQVDPEGKRAETYGNPTFDADSPDLARRHVITNGTVAFTETSGRPFDGAVAPNNPCNKNKLNTGEGSEQTKSGKSNQKNEPQMEKAFNSLSYENESYQEYSPGMTRKPVN